MNKVDWRSFNSQSMIKNSDFSLGTYRTRATTALRGQRSVPPSAAHSRYRAGCPHPQPLSRSVGEEAEGEGEGHNLSPSSPAAWKREGKVRDTISPLLSRSVGEEGGRGEGEGVPLRKQPVSVHRSAEEQKGSLSHHLAVRGQYLTLHQGFQLE